MPTTEQWLLIYQSGGGSTYEAMCISKVFGPYDSKQEAVQAGATLTKALGDVSSMHRDEGLAQVIQIPTIDPATDIQAYIDAETEYWT